MPFFNAETGELHDPEASAAVTHEQAQQEQALKDAAARIGTGLAKPATTGQPAPAPPKPGWPVLDTLEKVDAFRAAIAKDLWHPARSDDELMDYCVTQEWRLSGKEGEPEVVAQVFPTAKSRLPGEDALAPAPLPMLPDGHAWDEPSFRLMELDLPALGARTSFAMEIRDGLADVVEQEEQRGMGWTPEDARAELERRHGRDGAARVAANAQWVLNGFAEEPNLYWQRLAALAARRPNDPNLIDLLGRTIYDAFRDGPLPPAKHALMLRGEARRANADAARRTRAAEARHAEEAEAAAASDAAFDRTAAQHRRWGGVEP